MSRIELKNIEVALIDLNEGQVSGLPRNPRCWTYDDVQRLQRSIQETPELLEARGILVYPHNGRYVAIGGNMRLCAVRNIGLEEVSCMVLPEDMPSDKLKEIAIKDNGAFGSWDEELLKTEWSETPFAEWGIDVFNVESVEPKEKTVHAEDNTSVFEIVFNSEEFEFVNNALRELNPNSEEALLTILGYYDR